MGSAQSVPASGAAERVGTESSDSKTVAMLTVGGLVLTSGAL